VIAQLSHYGATLWVPEVGGPIDPESEVHDLIMLIFGGLSKAERNRLRTRVRTAVRAMAPEGRFLGGRPPYGYQLVRTGTPHPNPEKARQGIQLTTLAVDPATSAVVRQIFEWRAEGLGWRAIACRLTDQGVACPSAADRERNPHRHGRAWSLGAVRAIVMNPKYKGQGVFGRYHKVERLLDVNDPSAGNVTRMVPSTAEDVIYTDDIVVPIVSESLWERAQPDQAPVTRGPRPERTTDHDRYALRGLIVCENCGRKMQGNMVKRRSGAERLGYRCTYRSEYPGDSAHPTGLFVAEARILPAVDAWLDEMTSPANLEGVVASILQGDTEGRGEDPELRRARSLATEARTKLDRFMAAIEAGMDPALWVERTRTAQQELASAEAVIRDHDAGTVRPLTAEIVKELLLDLGGLVRLLDEVPTSHRRDIYRAAGVHLRYNRTPDGESLIAALRVEFSRVEGGT
jgi:site-specific DNA recombinase